MSETSFDNTKSNVAEFYNNRSILITGGTGFLGKTLIEKLLRSCPRLKNIYILLREKRNKQPGERFQELFNEPLFDLIRKDDNLLAKVKMIEGDITEKNLGMSIGDLIKVISEVSVVFHVAATVRFDEPLRTAININVIGTKNIVDLCHEISELAALVHVSTAYANYKRDEVDEHVYPIDDPEYLINMWNAPAALREHENEVLDSWPNTYTYTKAVGEWLLVRTARDLPVVICRPSIITASWKEPFEGWIDNLSGLTGISVSVGKGLIRSMLGESKYVADLIPVDIVTNTMIVSGWFAKLFHANKLLNRTAEKLPELIENHTLNQLKATELTNSNNQKLKSTEGQLRGVESFDETAWCIEKKIRNRKLRSNNETISGVPISIDDETLCSENVHDEKNGRRIDFGGPNNILSGLLIENKLDLRNKKLPEEIADVPVIHCTSGTNNPIIWGRVFEIVVGLQNTFPSIDAYRCPNFSLENNKFLNSFYQISLHYLPACAADFSAALFRKETHFRRTTRKIDNVNKMLSRFTTREWRFDSKKSRKYINIILSEEDKKLFNYDISCLDWSDYLSGYVLGMRKFILKESPTNLDIARKNLKFAYFRNLTLQLCPIIFLVIYLYLMGLDSIDA